mgnify:CR=1 FL=1
MIFLSREPKVNLIGIRCFINYKIDKDKKQIPNKRIYISSIDYPCLCLLRGFFLFVS